jgi:hypothetical protein
MRLSGCREEAQYVSDPHGSVYSDARNGVELLALAAGAVSSSSAVEREVLLEGLEEYLDVMSDMLEPCKVGSVGDRRGCSLVEYKIV